MRTFILLASLLFAVPQAPAAVVLTADTPQKTVEGNTFIAPAGWTVDVKGQATILTPPEAGSHIAIVDVKAKDADAAVAAAWEAYLPDHKWPFKIASDAPDKDGWTNIRGYSYETSPNEKRSVGVSARKANDVWTVVIYDMEDSVGEKRGAQVSLILGRLLPKGYQRESFAGKKANTLDAKRIAELSAFIDSGRKALGVPGVSIGVIQNGKVVLSRGFGTRELGLDARPDGDTLYMIASNTKALTTLMLAKLVDEKKITWNTPVTKLFPSFKLGNEETTRQVLVRHLICACTGLPRQDLEWLMQYGGMTPSGAMATLATVQPTTKFGEIFQYSNLLAGAAGFVGGHVLYPDQELGAAYDRAMTAEVFKPLGMTATTFDFQKALAANHATAHSLDIDGKPARALFDIDYSIVPVRPAGGAWSSVNDLLKYVRMEIDEGKLPDGKPYISSGPLLERRVPQVPIGKDVTYGMGLMVDSKYGIPVVHHGGDMIGYHSDMIWLPQQKVGAVILTNSDPGVYLRGPFMRKLLELLFDGNPEADRDVQSAAKRVFEQLAAERKLLTVPPDADAVAKLASHYRNAALGDVVVTRSGDQAVFDFTEWKSEVASKKNPDGTISFITIHPGVDGFEFVPGTGEKRTLVLRDAQHEYTFTEQ